MATANRSEIIDNSPAEPVADDRPEQNPTAGVRILGGEAGERASSPEPAEPAQHGASRDFPYFEFYPYGYLY